jgi:hypothetical protein
LQKNRFQTRKKDRKRERERERREREREGEREKSILLLGPFFHRKAALAAESTSEPQKRF